MQPPAVLPMMLPLQLRNHSENADRRAQEHYAKFRSTVFTPNTADGSTERGPGSLFGSELNSMAGRAHRKNFSLYKNDRVVNPVPPPAVDATYHTDQAFDVAAQVKTRGNVAAPLLSTTPRFLDSSTLESISTTSPSQGPGSYSPERFTGAFPILSERVTPFQVRAEKRQTREDFDRAFAICPSPPLPAESKATAMNRDGTVGRLMTRNMRITVGASKGQVPPPPQLPFSPDTTEWQGMQSNVLKAALTPKNAYTDKAKRQLLLLKEH